MSTAVIINTDDIQSKIYTIRNLQVMLDSDLAFIYQVGTKVLNQAVKRNIERFPDAFRFQLTSGEWESIIGSQNATSNLKSQSVTTSNRSQIVILKGSDSLTSHSVT